MTILHMKNEGFRVFISLKILYYKTFLGDVNIREKEIFVCLIIWEGLNNRLASSKSIISKSSVNI